MTYDPPKEDRRPGRDASEHGRRYSDECRGHGPMERSISRRDRIASAVGVAGEVGGVPYRLALLIYHPRSLEENDEGRWILLCARQWHSDTLARIRPVLVKQIRIDLRDLGYPPLT